MSTALATASGSARARFLRRFRFGVLGCHTSLPALLRHGLREFWRAADPANHRTLPYVLVLPSAKGIPLQARQRFATVGP